MDGGRAREKRAFEPPPWEREAFERFQREHPVPVRHEASSDEVAAESPTIAAPTPKGTGVDEESDAPELLDRQVVEMVARLGVQEADGHRKYTTFASVIAALFMASGLGFGIWAIVRLVASGKSGGSVAVISSLFVFVWGLMIAGVGVALWRKYNS